ncbi:unnamed protein product [Adineta ricciae]|uniref:Pentapeptide repeat-containing protein n=1 Tax=Adineta ricciae TaxID=249248 RepID=A0A816E5I7_ADIRI|nr:unnamed protein product [Adineta ricciae]CAF1644546.1 unnamed protein product [Adineta ricciae]
MIPQDERQVKTKSSALNVHELENGNNRRLDRHRRDYCSMSMRDWFQVLGSFLLPLLLAIFTVVITFEQRKDSNIQRLEDRALAREQREQDLNMSSLQRESDKVIAEERRVTDNLNAERQRNMSIEQRQHELIIEQQRYEKQQEQRSEDAKLAAEQRAQDLDIAEQKRIADNLNAKEQRDSDRSIAQRKQLADDLNAEKERNVSREIEEYRFEQAKSRDLDALLLSHINDMGTLLENHNGSLTANPIINALARAKTLHVIRSVGVERSTRLIQFLFDAGQLTRGHHQQPLNLSGAILHRINMSAANDLISMSNLSLAGIHMNEATFVGQDLSFWNFTGALLNYANFSRSNCKQTIFDRSSMVGADFSHATLDKASFRRADLTSASFAHSSGERCIFYSASLSNSTFCEARMGFGNFHQSNFNQANLEKAYMSGSSFAFASLLYARMNGIYLLFANLSYSNMFGAECMESQCRLQDALSLLHAVLPNGTNSTVSYQPTPLLRNGYANCTGGSKNEHLAGWKVLADPVHTTRNYHKEKICVFTPEKGSLSQPTSMLQRTNISLFDRLIVNGHAIISVNTRLGEFAKLKISEIDRIGSMSSVILKKPISDASDITVWQKSLHRTTVEIEIEAMFQISRVSPMAWVEYIDLTILLWLP